MGNLNMIRKDDSEIKQAVQEEFKWDTRIKETEIGVEVKNGVVTLTGTVSSYAEKMAAQEAAHFVTGVLDVANDIEVKAPGSPGRTDTEIAQAVRHALEWDVGVPHERIRSTVSDGIVNLDGNVNFLREREAKLIRISVTEGNVILTGKVGSFAEKRAILGALSHAPGIRTVTDHLRIESET